MVPLEHPTSSQTCTKKDCKATSALSGTNFIDPVLVTLISINIFFTFVILSIEIWFCNSARVLLHIDSY